MEDGNNANFELSYVEAGFEPLTRARSNTWPMPRPTTYVDGPLINEEAMSSSKESIKIDSSVQRNPSNQGDEHSSIKKKSSRRKPWGNVSYAELISQAINSVKDQRLTLSQIYDWMVENVPYFKEKSNSNNSAGWKNSIRHNLSLHNRFMRVPNVNPGKSSWWMINSDVKLERATRRRATSMEAGKHEKTRDRAKKLAEILQRGRLQTDVVSSNISQGIDFSPGSRKNANEALQSPAFRQRTSSCAFSYERRRLSPIPAANEPELTQEYTYEQGVDSLAQPTSSTPVYQNSWISPLDQQQVNLPSLCHIEHNNAASNNLHNISATYTLAQICQLCPEHQLQSCNCNLSMFQVGNTLPTPDQSGSYLHLESKSETSEITPLIRNNSLLDDINEIITREQYSSIDLVNNSMSMALCINDIT